jgi:signal transduction histidine kinase
MRIARELHDTLLQTIQASHFIAAAALETSGDPSLQHQTLQKLSGWLARAVWEARAALNSLRRSTENDLAEALRRAIAECQSQSTETSFSVIGDPRDMHPLVQDEIYRIGYEAIRNAYKHAHASHLEVELRYAQDLGLRVTDNGVGIEPTVINSGKQAHFGLLGMRERATHIGGRLTVVSGVSGTEMKLVVPAAIVFHNTNPEPASRVAKLRNLFARLGSRYKSCPPQ